MPNTVTAGDFSPVIEGENRNRIVTMRFDGTGGENYRLTPNQGAADNGDGFLVLEGDVWTNFDPRGQTWYLANPSGNADVDVYVMVEGGFGDGGGVD